MSELVISTLSQGCIFAIAALGIYITFRILDFPDLSVDGTFTTGASITAVAIQAGVHPALAVVLAIAGGLAAGICTGILHVKLKITNILSGIIVMIGLYSINLRIMGKSNIHLFNVNHMFTSLSSYEKFLLVAFITMSLKVLMDVFFLTEKGYILKALGENETFIVSLGIDANGYKILGLALANGCVALSGSLYAQYQGFADIGMGTGLIVSGLASIVIGEILFKKLFFFKYTSLVLLGSLVYRGILSFALKMGLNASDLKLVTAFLMVIILSGLTDKMAGLIRVKGVNLNVTNKKSMQNV